MELTQLERAGQNLRRTGLVTVNVADIMASAETPHYSVLYLRSGQKLMVRETLDEIHRLTCAHQAERELVKRFKRDLRECKARGIPLHSAFAAVWEQTVPQTCLSEEELARIYRELADWAKRWLK